MRSHDASSRHLGSAVDACKSLVRVERRLDGILPVHFNVREAVLMEEREPDVWQVRETFAFGG